MLSVFKPTNFLKFESVAVGFFQTAWGMTYFMFVKLITTVLALFQSPTLSFFLILPYLYESWLDVAPHLPVT